MSHPFLPIETATIVWRDGFPYSPLFTDNYFSKENGLAEAEHVFIAGNQLIERWQNSTNEAFVIGETGFGTGLNFLLTWFFWLKHAPLSATLHYISCEKYPLTHEQLDLSSLKWPLLQNQAQCLRDNYPVLTPGFHHLLFEKGRLRLTLMLGEATTCFRELLLCGDSKLEPELRSRQVDAWYLDGFSPANNQAMWSSELVQLLALLSKAETTLATYVVEDLVQTNLSSAGFVTKKIKGYGAKREMVKAQFKETREIFRTHRQTPWFSGIKKSRLNKKALVLGAGLAGCYTAQALASRGWQVTLLDENNTPGQGASGNRQAVLYPMLSAYRSPLTVFMLTAFLFARKTYQQILHRHPIGNLSGALQFAVNEKEKATQARLSEWLRAYPELGIFVDKSQASTLAGIKLKQGGLFIPGSGWLDSAALCRILIQSSLIEWVPNVAVDELHFADGCWHVDEFEASVLILANGYQSNQFIQTANLPLKVIRGQMTFLGCTTTSEQLKIPLCGEGHVLPAYDGMHAIGASYQIGNFEKNNLPHDDAENLSKLARIPASVAWSTEVKTSWSGLRTAAPDYLPLVGPVPDKNLFMERFASLASDAKRWVPQAGAFLPGLFLCTGFGSRGLTTIPLAAEWLASLIHQEFSFLPSSMIRAFSPARFLVKELTSNSSGKFI